MNSLLVYVIISVSGHYAGFIQPVPMALDACRFQVQSMQAHAQAAAAALGAIHYTVKLTCEARKERPEEQ